MANQYVNKVVQSNGTTIMDITDTTATASDVLAGKYFYLANGGKVAGNLTFSTITISSSNPSGGNNGDIWIKTS